MDSYSDSPFEEEEENCGTVGCAVGHGPYAGIEKIGSEDWNYYSQKSFGIDFMSLQWSYCFAVEWVGKDNTPQGAAKRLQNVLDGTITIEEMTTIVNAL